MNSSNIKSWLSSRPKWIQKAAEMLLQKNNLEEKDCDELLDTCLKEANNQLEKVEYNFTDISFHAENFNSFRLLSIENIQNINALSPTKPLIFGDGKLVVIYGPTATGKSSYVRILKHACGSPNIKSLYPNIFSDKSIPQSYIIKYEKNDIELMFEMKNDLKSCPDLKSVNIFDTTCSRVFITKENEIVYEPPILSIFSGLISLCDKISRKISEKIDKLISNTPLMPPEYKPTPAGDFYNNLNENTPIDKIDYYCKWTEYLQSELNNTEQRLSEQTPDNKIRQLQNKQKYIDEFIKDSRVFLDKLSDRACKQIFDKKKQIQSLQNKAVLSAKNISEGSNLKGIESETWKLFWEYAKKYSEEYAYKGKIFPYLDEGSYCLLCQQPLSEEAIERMQSFRNYMDNMIQKELLKKQNEFDSLMLSINNIPIIESIKRRLNDENISIVDYQLIESCYTLLKKRREQLKTEMTIKEIEELPKTLTWIDNLQKLSEKYQDEASQYEEDMQQNNRSLLLQRRNELKAHKWVSEQHVSIYREIERFKLLAPLKKAKELSDTTALSKKTRELADELITEEFMERFYKELKDLGAGRIKIKFTIPRVEKGHLLCRLCFPVQFNGPVEEILSEGEQRIVALSFYFANIYEKQNISSFVFDDPITSLDQDYEEQVVSRLINLSKERQVIIFTHRPSFLALIEQYTKSKEYKPLMIYLRKESGAIGEPDVTYLHTENPKSALITLLDELNTIDQNPLEINIKSMVIKGLCSHFRIILERMIEIDLLGDIVRRYRRNIITKGKLFNLAKIQEEDCKLFDNMITKYSIYEHDQPLEAPISLPTVVDIREDVNKMIKWYEDFRKRLKNSF